jgi:hypothetical protein
VTILSSREYATPPVSEAVTAFLRRLEFGFLVDGYGGKPSGGCKAEVDVSPVAASWSARI